MLHSDLIIVNDDRAFAGVPVADTRNSGGFLLVYRDGMTVDESTRTDRQAWGWKVLNHEGFTLDFGNDITSPYWPGGDKQFQCVDAVRTLIAFLSAAAESGPDGENADLFSPATREWAEQHSDELTMLDLELAHLIGEDK